MKCLAINTATKILSIALVDGDSILQMYKKPESRDQGNTLVTEVKTLLEKQNLSFDDLDLLAVVTGPGSFTGIRVGVSAMRGFALAANKPLVGVSTFEMFSNIKEGFVNIVAVESWRDELYFAVLNDKGENLIEPINDTAEVLFERLKEQGLHEDKIIISGDASEALKDLFKDAEFFEGEQTAVDVALKAIEKFKSNEKTEKASPYYMREADVTISSKIQKRVIAD